MLLGEVFMEYEMDEATKAKILSFLEDGPKRRSELKNELKVSEAKIKRILDHCTTKIPTLWEDECIINNRRYVLIGINKDI
jgi:predicted transcriptional regulator